MGTLIVAAYDNENEESFPAKYPEVIGVKGIKKIDMILTEGYN